MPNFDAIALADTPSGLDVEILYVVQFAIPDPVDPEEPDYDFGLMIVGSNFDNGAEPIVKFMGTPCDILGSESFDDLNQEKNPIGNLYRSHW